MTRMRKTLIYNVCLSLCIYSAVLVNARQYFTINGNQIQYEQKGKGQPVIIFVAGYGGSLRSFDPVFDKLSELTTVIRYSRSGLGNSSYINEAKDFDSIINELELLIDSLHAPTPLVLVGHSYGGLMIRAYAKRHPSKVAGLVFDDATFEDYFVKLGPLKKNAEALELKDHEEVMKKYRTKAMDDEFKSLWKVWHSPTKWKNWFDPMPAVPTVVLTSMKIADSTLRSDTQLMNARYLAHSRWIRDKPFSMQIGIVDAGHFVHRDKPDLFVEAIQMLLSIIRK